MTRKSLTVVKIGGNVIDDPIALESFVKDFAQLPGPKVLVHGGGKEATRLGETLGVPAVMIDGRRVTTRETLDVVTMVYAGLLNKRIVALLQQAGCDAIGLSGADGRCITAQRRSPEPIDFGYVGDIRPEGVNAEWIKKLIATGAVPVVCAIMYDGDGGLLNCNADSVASALAIGMSRVMPVKLVMCFEKAGVLADVDNPDSLIQRVDETTFAALREAGVIAKGMIPKLTGAFAALNQGVNSVLICHSSCLLTGVGTTITA